MPINIQNAPVDFKIVKPSFIKFIKLVREIRLNSLGKRGLIIIPKSELDKITDLKTEYYIRQLINDGILELLKNRRTHATDRQANITVFCNTIEEIDKYLKSLHLPGSSGLIIESNGKHIERQGQSEKFYNFEERDAAILNFLYKNAGKPQTDAAIAEACEVVLHETLTPQRISYSLTNIRRRFKERLNFSEKEVLEMLPKYKHGGHVLKI